MSTTNTPSRIFLQIAIPNSQIFLISPSPPYPKPFDRPIITSRPPLPLLLRCSSSSGQGPTGDNLTDALSGMVGEEVEQLLNREENKVLLDGLEQASLRVEKARRDLAEIEKQEIEAKSMKDYVKQLEARAAEIAESRKEISEAREMLQAAGASLGASDGDGSKEIDKDKERFESVKAALISALVGTLVSLPISSTQVTDSVELILPIAITAISCALFGVTFRYSVRRDLDNFQLKTGTPVAFGFVKGLATLGGGSPLELNPGSIFTHAYDGAIYVSQSLFIFISAAVALDLCIKVRILSPFPMKR